MKTLQKLHLSLLLSFKSDAKTTKSTGSHFLFSCSLVILFLASLQVKANTYFKPESTSHLSATLPGSTLSYSYVDFKILAYDYNGEEDRMQECSILINEGNNEFTKILSYKVGNNASYDNFTPVNDYNAGFAVKLDNSSSKDLRYTNIRWYYPQRLIEKMVTFRVNYWWKLNWYHSDDVDYIGTHDDLKIQLPVFTADTIVNPALKVVDGTTDGKWFDFSWDSYSSYGAGTTTRLDLYSDANYLNKIFESTTTNGVADKARLTLLGLNQVNTVWPKTVYTNKSDLEFKVYEYKMDAVSVAGFAYPKSNSMQFDACSKKATLSWTIANPKTIDVKSKIYIFRKRKDASIYTLISSGLANNIVKYEDTDASLEWDTQYDYIVRSCPDFLSTSAVEFTNTSAIYYMPELIVKSEITTTRQNIDFSSFTATAHIAEEPKIANVELSWKATWCTNNPQYISIVRVNTLNPLDIFSQEVLGSSLKFVDTSVKDRTPYRYCLIANNSGRSDSSKWADANVVDQCKFISLTTTKGVLNDRVRLSWQIDKPLLNTKFVISRKIYDNNSSLFNYEIIAEKQSTNNIDNWEDLSISPGILYKYKVESYYQPATGSAIITSTADSVGLGFSQPIGTISGNVVFGTGTSVEGVNVSVENTNAEQKLYKSIEFNTTDAGKGGILKFNKPLRHGCIANGFTWQAWIKAPSRSLSNATIYEMMGEYSIQMNENKINIFINGNSTTTPLISSDISSINSNQFFQLSVSYNKSTNYLKLYKNGVATDSVKLTATYAHSGSSSIALAKLASSYQVDGKNFLGNIDEMRLWNRALTAKEISSNYDRYLAGSETDLIGYWQMDDGVNIFAFDKSNVSKSYNENHITLIGASSSDTVPALTQLSIKATTDKNGNYLIQGVPYKGNGSTYSVVPALGTHEFEPSSQQIYIGGSSSEVQSKISFKDISSFTISGYIYYENTTYPVANIEFLVDGNVCTRENKKLLTDANGFYEIDVPIGEHKISLFKSGHTFIDSDPMATLKMDKKYNFKENKTNINFTDLTKVTLVGRVVGGAIQSAKPIGFKRSVANIGVAKLKIQPKLTAYQLNSSTIDSLVLTNNYSKINSISKVAPGNNIINITTDESTGEFLVQVPPVPMKIIDVQTIGLDKSAFKLEKQPMIDMNPIIVQIDTIHSGTKIVDEKSVTVIDTCKYNQRIYLTYKVQTPVFTIQDRNYSYNAYGDTIYNYVDPNNSEDNTSAPIFTTETTETAIDSVIYKLGSPVFTQGNIYRYNVEAYEKYDHPISKAVDKVPLSNKIFNIENKLSLDPALTEYALDSTGNFIYSFTAGLPVLISPYTMGMTATLDYDDGTVSWKNGTQVGIRGIVLGAAPVGGVDFITKGPDKVIAVLRDPPGTNSFASLEKGSTITNTRTYKGIGTESTGHKFIANLGGSMKLCFGMMEIDNKLDIGGGIEQSVKGSDATSRKETFTTSETISTSADANYIGAKGDVYIANSSNIGFAKCNQLGLKPVVDKLEFTQSTSYFFIPMGDSTSFRYTQNHIVSKLLPTLRAMRKSVLKTVTDTTVYNKGNRSIYLTKLDSTDLSYGQKGTYNWVKPTSFATVLIDSVLFYSNEINQWENIILNNEKEKIWATGKTPVGNNSTIKYDKLNLSYDAGTVLSKSITRTSNCVTTNEVAWDMQAVFTSELGLTVNEFGFTIENSAKVGGGEEKTTSTENENSITYKYTLEDADAGNYFSVDVFTPQSQTVIVKPKTNFNKEITSYVVSNVEQEGGPIFVTRGGATSCPYEKSDMSLFYKNASKQPEALSTATVQIEKPGIEVLIPTVSGIASGKKASYDADLKNLSESNTSSWFQLYVDSKTNPKGAIINIDGNPLTEPRLFLISPKASLRKSIQITQSSLDNLNFDGIRLVFQSICDTTIKASALISASFVPSCSDLTLQIDDRTLNSETGSTLNVIIKDFDKNYKNFGGIRLQYKGINDLNWSLAKDFVFDSKIMKDSKDYEIIGKDKIKISYAFPMVTDPDQTYQFRARTVCAGDIYNETPTINVVKDMKRPLSMGLPSPSNGVLTPESEISVTFNENIQVEQIAATDIRVYGVLNGFTEKDNVGLSFDGTQKAYTELPLNLKNSSFTIEGKFLPKMGNTEGTIFSLGEGDNNITLQRIDNDLNVLAGKSFFTRTPLAMDTSFQYFAVSYDVVKQALALMLWSNKNTTKNILFTATLTNGIAPVGRLIIGENFKGSLRQLSVWNEARSANTIAAGRSVSKTGKEMNLAGYWAMDEGYGKLAVDKARGRNFTVGSSWFITPMGFAAELNGTNHIVAKSWHIPLTTENDFGLEFWFKGAAGQKNANIYSCEGDTLASKNLSLAFNADGNLDLKTNGNTYQIAAEGTLGSVWHHFALSVMRGGNANIYIDGALKNQTSATNIGGMACDSIAFGALRYFAEGATKASITNRFDGAIDEVRIWKNALTSENINLNMRSKMTGNETGLIAYYPFETYNSSMDVVSSLTDALILSDTNLHNGGMATGKNVNFTNNTSAIKVSRPRVLVKSNITASDNKIMINIDEAADRIENCVLEFEMERVMDVNSNRMASPLKWTAFVNMNRLKWDTESVNLTKEVLSPLTFEAVISNSSGKYENYVVSGLPSWLSVNKTQGTLSPLNKATLVFTVDKSANVGAYECAIRLTGSKFIDEILPVNLKVTGPRPDWSVNPYDFTSSMNVIGQIKIENVSQEDSEDIVAAFNGTKCVGMASPQFDNIKNSYILYMDIYGNDGVTGDNGKALTFSLWDAGTGRIYPEMDLNGNTISYISLAIIGNIEAPQVLNASDKVEQQLGLKQGWNWISTNVTNSENTLINQFKTGMETSGIQLKSRSGDYIDYANGVWAGTEFNDLNQTTMYMVKTNQPKTLKLIGATAKSTENQIIINPNWNWIGYVPQFVSPLKDALSGLTAIEGDQIKGQIGFASYSGGKWYGSLAYMTPGLGYMYYSKNSEGDLFSYPSQYVSLSKVAKQSEEVGSMRWAVDVNKYQMSMTVTGTVSINNNEVANSDLQVAVFVGNECRGTATLKYVDSYKRYMAFLMVWGNMEDVNKIITFKSFNTTNTLELIGDNQSLAFVPDNIIGTAVSPYQISFAPSSNAEVNMNALKIYPNPVNDMLHFEYDPSSIQQLEVIDNVGRVMLSDKQMIKNSINVGHLTSGVYTLRIKQNGNVTNHLFIRK